MLMNAMKPQSQAGERKKLKKLKTSSVTEEIKEEDKANSDAEQSSKAKKSTGKTLGPKKKAASLKKPEDTMTRFFNSYGESPHLQAIEDSYLQYLQQQYAK